MRKSDERKLQQECVKWLRETRPNCIWFHPANGENRNIITGVILKRMGVRAGVPDLIVILHGGKVMGIEFKASGGRLSLSQRVFQENMLRLGASYAVVSSLPQFMTEIEAAVQGHTREEADDQTEPNGS